MAFENDSNLARVRKIGEALDLIEKSAKANRATPADIEQLLTPVWTKIDELTGGDELSRAAKPAPVDTTTPAPEAAPEIASRKRSDFLQSRVVGLTPTELCDLIAIAALRIDSDVYGKKD